MAGIIILIIGSILLINQLDLFFIPRWLFSWPMWMIAYGIYMGGKYNFKKPIWIYIIVLGCAFLFTENIDNAGRFIWPVTVMGLGTWMVLKHHDKRADARYHENSNYKEI
ncbi:MAG: hypothetical protein JWQ84_2586 [Mucilaginibacter sp.]|nr:hypothetical protein [Mucilaginibacter sp.]